MADSPIIYYPKFVPQDVIRLFGKKKMLFKTRPQTHHQSWPTNALLEFTIACKEI